MLRINKRQAGFGFAGVILALGLPAVAAARTQVVWAGGQNAFQSELGKRYSAEALSFFPSTVTIRVGDTIVWKGMSIDFHTIDIPGPSGRALPLITPTGPTVSNVDDFAGDPFWFDGKAAQLGLNPALLRRGGGHTYNGSTRVHSALPFAPGTFAVNFTKAGRYAYFCDVHPGMRGLVKVLPRSRTVPSRADNAATVAGEQAQDLTVAAKLARTKIKGNRVSLGLNGQRNVEVLGMFQGVTHIKAGTTVAFAMFRGSFETHTASFAPTAYLRTLAEGFDMPLIDPRAVFRSSPPGTGPVVLDQTAHGNAFANTGALADYRGSRLPPLEKIKFTQNGTYHFECLIHPFMRGVIVVQ